MPSHPRDCTESDVYFQAREACNPYYARVPSVVQETMTEFAKLTGRKYELFEYFGHPQAERVLILMGSGSEAVCEMVEALNKKGEKIGVIKVRLFRPFSTEHLIKALPKSVQKIAVLDRTKEPGSLGEPLYQDIVTSLMEAQSEGLIQKIPPVVGGRYGLSSKEFTPGMIQAVFDELKKTKPKNHFTIGITDDVSNTSLPFDRDLSVEGSDVTRCVFYGLGKPWHGRRQQNSIKIIGERPLTRRYFVYDSKIRRHHHLLRWAQAHPLVLLGDCSQLVAVINGIFDKWRCFETAIPATLLVNAAYRLPSLDHSQRVQKTLLEKNLKIYVIDAKVARDTDGRTHQHDHADLFCDFRRTPRDEAISKSKSDQNLR